MKRLALLVTCHLSLVTGGFAAFTEFYCQNGGSNINAGSTNNNTPSYTKAHGNWTQSTGVFTVQDGTNPSSSVSVGQWGAIMVDGGTVAAYVGRITAVQNANNGTITLNTASIGSKPANQTATATITVGGAWQGPNGASGFPFTLTSYGNNVDSSSHMQRTNLKNDQTYSVTASFAPALGGNPYVVQGYTSTVNDGGKAVMDGGTSTGAVLNGSGPGSTMWADLKFTTSITTGSSSVVTTSSAVVAFIRCIFTGAHSTGLGLVISGTVGASVTECEFYNNGWAGAQTNHLCRVVRSYFHDNGGGLSVIGNNNYISDCIFDSNTGNGITVSGTTGDATTHIRNCDFYNNSGDAINISSSGNTFFYWIENCNFIKNTGAAINNGSVKNAGYVYNCGYGSGTQANGSADTLGNLVQSGTITYASGITPYNAPATGDFSNVLAASEGVGRGHFEENDGTNIGTVGYPDIGAAQANIGCPYPTPTFTPTSTPTPTATSTATATFTPTATATASFTPCAPTPTATATFTPTSTPTPTDTPTPTVPPESSHVIG